MFKKTVDGVLAGFRKTVDDLRAIAAQQQSRIEKIEEEQTLLELESVAARAERNRAEAIANKLDRLISE